MGYKFEIELPAKEGDPQCCITYHTFGKSSSEARIDCSSLLTAVDLLVQKKVVANSLRIKPKNAKTFGSVTTTLGILKLNQIGLNNVQYSELNFDHSDIEKNADDEGLQVVVKGPRAAVMILFNVFTGSNLPASTD
jgi:hypothetical protein